MTVPRILIARIPPFRPHAYDVVAEWISTKHPALARHFDLCALPFRIPQESPYRLLVQWLQDPLDVTDPVSFLYALELQAACEDQQIPIINRVERHKNTAKTATYERLTAIGIRTPQVFTFASKAEFWEALPSLNLPVILREDVGHAGDFHLIRTVDEGRAAPYEAFYRPIITEYIDVRSPDGRYRKYRCVVAGDSVVSHHVQTSETWLTRGSNRIKDGQTREEEIEYISQPDPFESVMKSVSAGLELEFVGIDYGVDATGQPVIWEANQYPHLHFSKVDLIYRNFAMERTIAAMVLAYVTRAGIEPTAKLIRQASYGED